LAKVSSEAGVHVVAATGFHRAEHYAPEVVERTKPGLAELSRAATGEGPGMPYLLTGIRPRLIRRFGEEFATQVFVGNPASAFAAAWGGTVRS
jgi:predicted metal-dependent phosphotriesterase family hydrolase